MKKTVRPEQNFFWPVRIYWEDTDAGGIVFYANYLKFFERARTEWLRSRGIGQQLLREETGGMFVVSESNIRYHRPARLDDELLVTAFPLQIGQASLTIRQQALKLGPTLSAAGPPQGARAPSGGSAAGVAASVGAAVAAGPPQGARAPSGGSEDTSVPSVGANVLCEGTIRIAWVDAVTMKPVKMPQTILEALK